MQKQNNSNEPEQAAQKRFSQEIRAMPKAGLHRAAIKWRQEQDAKQARAPQHQRSGPSLSR